MRKKKKWKEIRSMVTMMAVMVAMLSTATYAWFSLTSNPVVNGLQMTAVADQGLWISEDGTTWFNAVDLNDTVNDQHTAKFNNEDGNAFLLKPATLTSKVADETGCLTFYTPKYKGNTVYGPNLAITDKSGAANGLTGYVACVDYYLKSTGDSDVQVGIRIADIVDGEGNKITQEDLGVVDGIQKTDGSFVVEVSSNENDESTSPSAIETVRVAFVVADAEAVNGYKVVVWEPNRSSTDVANTTHATNSFTTGTEGIDAGEAAVTADVISTLDEGYIFEDAQGNINNAITDSDALFTVGTSATKIKMYVWFEGQDDHCVDQIIQDQIEAQVQFIVVPSN